MGGPAQLGLLKDLNRASILAIVRETHEVTRAEVARRSGLSKATASLIVDDFIQAGLLRELGSGRSTGGRPPQMLEFIPNARTAVGAEFAHDTVTAVLTDFAGRILAQSQRSVTVQNAEHVLIQTADLVLELLRDVDRARVLGLGFASPGLVDVERGIVKEAIDVGWREVPAAQLLRDRLNLPVAVANRSKTAALAESWTATGVRGRHLIYAFLGSGIAAGIVHDERLFVGATSSAGELGHMTVDPAGPVCECGNSGCLHVFAGEEAIARRARELVRQRPGQSRIEQASRDSRHITADTVIDGALAGDALSLDILREVGTFVGIALANVVNLMNPDEIIIGGPTSRAGAALLEPIRAEIQRRALSIPARHVNVRLSTLGATAGAFGGAILVLQSATQWIFPGDGSFATHISRPVA
jgi:predicted NBD/HSP70 family sugar kinase